VNLLEKFVFEMDLEYSLGTFFKYEMEIGFDKDSAITNSKVEYHGAQLMSLFAVDAEIETKNILKKKFGERVELIGGKEAADILVEGTSYAFNVKTMYESTTTLKLCSVNTPKKVKNYDYRFITFTYKLNEKQNKIIMDKIYVFNFADIEDAIYARDNNYYVTLNNIIEYVQRRDDFVHGKSSRFRRLGDITINEKASIPKYEIVEYLERRMQLTSEKIIRKRFAKHYNLDNLSYLLKELKSELKIGATKDGLFHSVNLIMDNRNNIQPTKMQIAQEQYELFRKKEIDDVEDVNAFRQYLKSNYDFSSSLASKYISKISKEKKYAQN